MDIDEIKTIVQKCGLDPAKIDVYEPAFRKTERSWEFSFGYRHEGRTLGYHFLITDEVHRHHPRVEAELIKEYLIMGLENLKRQLK